MEKELSRTGRLQIVLSEQDIGRLKTMQGEGAPSMSAAARQAIELYDFLITEIAAGGTLVSVTETPEGKKEKEIWII